MSENNFKIPPLALKLESSKLYLKPLTYIELLKYLESPEKLAKSLCLNDNHNEADQELKEAITNEFLPFINEFGKEFLFYTLWLLIRKEDTTVIGSVCFHGEPVNGKVEIGYGVYSEFRNFGYMTEAIQRLIDWTIKRPDIQFVFAETDISNLPSQKVLQKTGFAIENTDIKSFIWKLKVK
jgi:[ribosomal protein S5]-alanine N-acetyltransferase